MLISKFNLYRTEWLDLVFADRNKEYGAYYLRQHYAGNMAKAMGITFLSIGLLCGASIILRTDKPVYRIITVDNKPVVVMPPPVAPIKRIEPPQPIRHIIVHPPATTVATTRFVTLVVKPDPITEKPPVIVEIKGAIGTETTKGLTTGPNVLPTETPSGTGTPGPDDSLHPLTGLDVMPEPMGGSAAWAKFLSKNLHYPYDAQNENASGRVYLSFIIEKDGHLSNISIDRAAGHGFDEEAMRVLKMAKAWKPGMQNGQPVRVKYQIPINFQSTSGD